MIETGTYRDVDAFEKDTGEIVIDRGSHLPWGQRYLVLTAVEVAEFAQRESNRKVTRGRPAGSTFCEHFITAAEMGYADPWAGTTCKLPRGHDGAHSAHYPKARIQEPRPLTDAEQAHARALGEEYVHLLPMTRDWAEERWGSNPEKWPTWVCTACGQWNSGWCLECGRCEAARPIDGPEVKS